MQGIKAKIRDNNYLNWMLIISNWLFQGIIHADKTEKIYKVFFSLILWVVWALFLYKLTSLTWVSIVVFSFIIAHTLNWLINGNLYILLIHRLNIGALSKPDLFDYLEILRGKLQYEDWVLYAASFGSICRGALKDSSDIDLSIVRKPGLRNALKSIWFSVKEKKIADLKKIPLEIYISDTPEDSIKRFKAEQNPVVIFDPENTIDKYYSEELSISAARKLNKVQ